MFDQTLALCVDPAYDFMRGVSRKLGAGTGLRFTLNAPHQFAGDRDDRLDAAMTVAWLADLSQKFAERFAHTLACHFNEAEGGHRQNLRRHAIARDADRQHVEQLLDILGLVQMDEIDDDEATD